MFDQSIQSGAISAGQFVAKKQTTGQWTTGAHFHPGGSTVGPIPAAFTSSFPIGNTVEFKDTPTGELVGSSGLPAAAFTGFPCTFV